MQTPTMQTSTMQTSTYKVNNAEFNNGNFNNAYFNIQISAMLVSTTMQICLTIELYNNYRNYPEEFYW